MLNEGKYNNFNCESNKNLIYQELKSLKEISSAKESINANEAIKNLPKPMQLDVIKANELLKEKLKNKISDNELNNLLEEHTKSHIKEITLSYIDKRFGCADKNYLRLEMVKTIDNSMEECFKSEDPTRLPSDIKLISFDVNGLKAVNDLSQRGHSAGDDYLKRIANVLMNGKTTQELSKQGVDCFVSSGAGDEFFIMLKNNQTIESKPQQLTALKPILRSYQKEISEMDCGDLIDFNDPIVQKKLQGIKIPKNFKFSGSISAGFSSLNNILESFNVDKSKNYIANIQRIMGQIIDASDKMANINKREYKEKIANGNEHERFLSLILKRNLDAMEMEIEIKKLRKKLEVAEKENKELRDKMSIN
ncbi:hypothetical protein B6D52_02325 [Candidatus Parcubacteria bacterium 4484_255]|nr:MAG: hypothetical protein B6D52_02325 [Candidatus Parcubacteria bacterium 4484_255]